MIRSYPYERPITFGRVAFSIFLLLIALLVVLSTLPAFAADATATTVLNLRPLFDLAISYGEPLVLALAAWIAARLIAAITKTLGLSIDDKQRQVVNDALDKAIAYGFSQVKGMGGASPTIDLKSTLVAHAAQYALEAVPQALKHFNITPDRLEAMILARVDAAVPAAPK
ncbi:hypothetical protein [uncultured Alsobacter sp.]|uniref:hypothetical protein n=1 Tax=uncultured Alsobacter sp. TaxID=1748258 RepID=UPI0025D97F9E|nr:hypothetical protein [uncultured Alsobacter sp.]